MINQHVGRSGLDSLIDTIAQTPTARAMLREAVNRWGSSVLLPTYRFFLTDDPRDTQHIAASLRPKLNSRLEEMMPLSPGYVAQPMALEALLPPDVAPSAATFAAHLIANRRAAGTMRRYASCFRTIINTSVRLDVCPYPMTAGGAISVVSTLAEDGATYSTLCAIRDTITMMHEFQGRPNPVRDAYFQHVWQGIRRVVGTAHPNRKLALYRDEVARMIEIAISQRRFDLATMIAICFEGAFRSAELLALTFRDVTLGAASVSLYVSRSKTDQTKEGAYVEIRRRPDAPFDAVEMLRGWINGRGPSSEPIFSSTCWPERSGSRRTLSRWLKAYAFLIGLDPHLVSTQSLRAGYVTTEIDRGASVAVVAAHLRHSSLDTLIYYYRPRRERPNFVGIAAESGAV